LIIVKDYLITEVNVLFSNIALSDNRYLFRVLKCGTLTSLDNYGGHSSSLNRNATVAVWPNGMLRAVECMAGRQCLIKITGFRLPGLSLTPISRSQMLVNL
jgi:hypothetical protein